MRVVVAGAGIGGLALAQGLARAGIEVVVLERDARPQDTGGYRLHLDDDAHAALQRLLPPSVLQAVLASAAGGETFRRFSICDHRMRVLTTEEMPPGDRLMIGRVPLRTLLAHGVDVRWRSAYRRHTTGVGGRLRVEHDGGTEIADVLVGADGTVSAVVHALAGRPLSAPVGVDGIAAKVPLDDGARALLPAALACGPALAIAPGGLGVFLSVHDPATSPVAPPVCTSPAAVGEPASLVLGPMLATGRFRRDPHDLDGPELVTLLGELLRGWHPDLRELARRADPATVASFRFRASDPDADPTPWPSGTVTAIGDAVHAMPPTGGQGAATAIRDADVLARHLRRARDGETTIPLALHAYEREMAAYGPDAVRESLRPLATQRRLSGPAGGLLLRAAGVSAGARSRLRNLRTARSRTGRPG
ncbi:FAD-dependent oxidoreductase [Pseudonocardia parietis]|uniref:2-polyprenyl-6-methoxyphenol hydroxylase-like FAD-dependent oxidoreductase n=1 Tax=Pseudonocardia parietis TaxID=570936 RepID=A0ABS4W1T1_9PSEU|nr:NAD(P)/FAD-dependent oxidoreductase [Pseudonocardia parietis]MBP2370068.1 2-polyprenyl-6-methoxyphenol hydroxylase-like FAD-dependent oxidoreductase [Pseudonocardia parietis]